MNTNKVAVAIIRSGNIGTDLMSKILRNSHTLSMSVMVGIDPDSDGLARARELGVAATHLGLDGLMQMPEYEDIKIIFDATSAKVHHDNAAKLKRLGKQLIDLTPAAIGPYIVPVVNLDEDLIGDNANMVTCGGQATMPMVAAVARVVKVHYAEIVASITSKSFGPGTRRANIDEFTETTSRAIEVVGGAEKGKAIIVLNPANPLVLMRNTVFTFIDTVEESAIENSITAFVSEVQKYVPKCRLKQQVQFEYFGNNQPLQIPRFSDFCGIKPSIFLEVGGAADYLPTYAGNLDIMTSAAKQTAERIAVHKFNAPKVAA